MNEELARRPGQFVFSPKSPWWGILNKKLEQNKISVQVRNLSHTNSQLLLYSSSQNDVPGEAQQYGTIATHTWCCASVLIDVIEVANKHRALLPGSRNFEQ